VASFKTKDGKAWTLALDLELADEILATTNIDLLDVNRLESTLADLACVTSPRRLVDDFLWPLVREQAGKVGADLAAFRKGIDGPALEAATNALVEAVADFFPSPAVRRVILAGVKVIAEQKLEAMRKSVETSPLTGPESGGSSGSMPDSPESGHATPGI
jgi:hypothetical protein